MTVHAPRSDASVMQHNKFWVDAHGRKGFAYENMDHRGCDCYFTNISYHVHRHFNKFVFVRQGQ